MSSIPQLLPVPQRINALLLLSHWLWVFALTSLRRNNVDVSQLIISNLPDDIRPSLTPRQIYTYSRQLAVRVTKTVLPLHLITTVLWSYSLEDSPIILKSAIQLSPLLQLLWILYLDVSRSKSLKYCIKRLPLIESLPGQLRTTYILLSDTLTSFARPIVDFTLFMSVTFLGTSEFDMHLDLLVASIPVCIRIFQCIREFIYYTPDDRTLIFNAIKYCTSLPILIATWHSKVYPTESLSHIKLFMAVHSIYSLVWDIKMDWKFDSLKQIRRTKLTFPKYAYHLAIVLDFALRFWWLWILAINRIATTGKSTFLLFDGEVQLLEVFRRCMWVIFKLECEHVHKISSK